MTARILDGKAAAEAYRAKVAEGVATFVREHGRAPGLEVVMVGDDPASDVYTRNKKKAAEAAGIRGVLHRLPAETSQAELLERVAGLNADPAVDGILVQLPLPRHIDPDRVIDAIDADKDVDGFTPKNAGLLASGRPNLVACTPKGCMHLLDLAGIDLLGARALVIGRSNIVGKPMAQLLLARHATVTIAHSRSRDLAGLCREADVLVAAVGRARMVKGDWVKPGAVVIDVGMNRDADGKLCGDVDTAAAAERALAITPVPGGVGPMTIACLLDNTLLAARHRAGAAR
ncbi:MAG: bifunctional methylenetetrahydrofolate dehydrogenase/methenyltetrahydrofolate cyclohydrolase FolD [Polyangiaceae bacterium]|nr:bifunctional methylenetetrahydrofolate dehydrogenase/methenyltetrahydrofolate cyclohydrolase FolD [Polyangiaceae bacterium]